MRYNTTNKPFFKECDSVSSMRVLLVITKGTWGGATKYVYDVARSLDEANIPVAVAYGPKRTSH